jgi:hypothetical protein
MPAKKKARTQEYVQYHNDGTIWAKEHTANGLPTGYGSGFGKTEPSCARVTS